MTNKYKINDEVLVRVKIKSIYGGDNPLLLGTYGIVTQGPNERYFTPDQIYSLAPDFDIGEEIEAEAK